MQVLHEGERHRFVVVLPEGEARLEYALRDRWVNVVHTWVPDSLRGRGVADAMMKACVDFCRQQHLQLVATCSYAVRWLEHKRQI